MGMYSRRRRGTHRSSGTGDSRARVPVVTVVVARASRQRHRTIDVEGVAGDA